MFASVYILVVAAVIVGAIALLFLWPRINRNQLRAQPLPETWLAVLQQRLPFYEKLPEALRVQLQQLIAVFINDKTFVGCAGLTITDEMRLTIAGQACLLLLNRPTHEYADLGYIYVYPSSFRATREVRDELGLVSTQNHDLLGESWDSGKVILAWDNVEHGVRNFQDGHNVVLHEFAHQLDQESGAANGAPLLYTKAAYKSWAYVFGREFANLQKQSPAQPSIIDHYGATNPAEFFAVATETFFEEPQKMYQHHRQLFDELQRYYRLDPRQWV